MLWPLLERLWLLLVAAGVVAGVLLLVVLLLLLGCDSPAVEMMLRQDGRMS